MRGVLRNPSRKRALARGVTLTLATLSLVLAGTACKPSLLNLSHIAQTIQITSLIYPGYPAGNTSNKIDLFINTASGITLSTPNVTGAFTVTPALPAYLSLDPITGVLSTVGVAPATAVALTAYSVTVISTYGTFVQNVTLQVIDNTPPPLTLSYTPNPAYFENGVAITPMSPTTTGGTPTTYNSVPGLPSGLSVDPSTGILTGIPGATQTIQTYNVFASNGGGSASTPLQIAIFEPPTQLAVTGPALGLTSSCLAYTVTVQDASSSATNVVANRTINLSDLVAGGSFFSNAGCTTGISSVTILAASSSATFYYSKPAPGNVTLTLSSSGLTNATQAVAISNAATKLVWSSGPTFGSPNACLSYTLQLQDAGSSVALAQSALSVSLTDGASGTFYSDSGCGTSITTTPIAQGTSNSTLYYKNTTPALVTLTASQGALVPASIQVLIATPATQLGWTGPATGTVNTCMTYTVETRDAGGGATKVPTSVLVNLASTGAAWTFYSDSGCTTTTTSGTVAALTQSFTVYYQKTTIGSVTLSATDVAATLTTATKAVTINDVPPSALTYLQNPVVYDRGYLITPNTVTYSGGPATSFTISPSLPTGLNFNLSTGAITGIPTVVTASANYTVTAFNSGGSSPVTLNLGVKVAPPANLSYLQNPVSYSVGSLILNNLPSSTGDPVVSYSMNPAPPPGLSFDTSTGILSGTPTVVAGVQTFTVTATNAGGSDTVGIDITIANLAPIVSSLFPSGGPKSGGTLITLYGQYFMTGATVTLGGINCGSVNVISATQLTCVSGVSTTEGLVNTVVTNTDSQSGTLMNRFLYSASQWVGGAAQSTNSWTSGGVPVSGSGDGMLNSTLGVTIDASDYLYIIDTAGNRMARYYAITGAFIGWIGDILLPPTGGAAGCNGATSGTFTPGQSLMVRLSTSLTRPTTASKSSMFRPVPFKAGSAPLALLRPVVREVAMAQQ